jgi:serine/threonine-protein kinase HipA
VDPQLHELLIQGSSALGGARPKNVVEDENVLWVAKFPAKGDRWNNAPVEVAMLELARRCGIQAPPTRIEQIGSQSVLLVRRFDRDVVASDSNAHGAAANYLRHRMVSALTVLDAEDHVSERRNWSYLLLADELQRWSERPTADRHELFRRMVLNALVSNTDDHPRNHALVAPGSGFHLAPVYDVTPQPATAIDARHLAMEVGRFGRVARRDNLVSFAPRFSLTVDDAHAIIDHIRATIEAEWEAEIRRQGGTAADCQAVRNAFVYAGFEYPSDLPP